MRYVFALFLIAPLSACDEPAKPDNGSVVVTPADDECPRDDGEPCR